jgi:hypothetical protein
VGFVDNENTLDIGYSDRKHIAFVLIENSIEEDVVYHEFVEPTDI